MTVPQRILQNAYHVADIDEAIDRFHALWGLGPFLVRRHIQLAQVFYRGQPASLDISAAYVQAGDLQVELVMQHNDTPSAFRDAFAAHEEGFHHVAVMPADYAATLAHYAAQGFPVVTELRTASGRGASYVDTRPLLGHMIEVYPPGPGLTALYAEVARAAAEWDGRTLRMEVDPAG